MVKRRERREGRHKVGQPGEERWLDYYEAEARDYPSADMHAMYHGGLHWIALTAGLGFREAQTILQALATGAAAAGSKASFALILLPSGAAVLTLIPKAECTAEQLAGMAGVTDPNLIERIDASGGMVLTHYPSRAADFVAELEETFR